MKVITGDIVRLKTGSPAMTVSSYNAQAQTVMCVWFVRDHEGDWTGPYEGAFFLDTLELSEADV